MKKNITHKIHVVLIKIVGKCQSHNITDINVKGETRINGCWAKIFITLDLFFVFEFIGWGAPKCSTFGFRFRRVCIQLSFTFTTIYMFSYACLRPSFSFLRLFLQSYPPSSLNERSLAPYTAFEASLAGIVLATRIPTRAKSYRDTRCASEICDRVNDAGTAAI